MSDHAKLIFAFSLGAAAGAFVAWKMLKTKYEQIALAEIDSMEEYYLRRTNQEDDDSPKDECEDIVTTEGYSTHSDISEEEGGSELVDDDTPFIITPEEFDDDWVGYEASSLTYYADGVLTDERNEPIKDVNALVGEDALTHFEDGEDSVYVRNPRLKQDFEILLDERAYSDVQRKSYGA